MAPTTNLLKDDEKTDAPVSRRSRKKEKTRSAIYAAAMKLFAARDYDAVTIEEICERADVAKATFFLHFSNKAALLNEFNERMTADLETELAHVGGGAETRLQYAVKMMVENWGQNAEIMRKMSREFFNQPALPQAASNANAGVHALITGIVKDGQMSGELRPKPSAELVAAALIASWGTVISAWSVDNHDIPSDAGEDLLNIMLRGLKSP